MEKIEHTEAEHAAREYLIARIEGAAGTLDSIPWNVVDTEDMSKLYRALYDIKAS